MSPRHHPTEVVLAGYASGALADGPGLTVSAHLERCPVCRARVRLFEEVGGALLADTPAVAMADNALALALAGIER
ncbi:MAG: transcriptional regulator, partial [Caulobacteraceae bacterium]|nr:transcriptional regulator [Caulobacteraceae bacterium]